jgi:hypothetical protein
MNVTLDGFMEGPNRELNDTAQVVDEDFDRYWRQQRDRFGSRLLLWACDLRSTPHLCRYFHLYFALLSPIEGTDRGVIQFGMKIEF